MIFENFFEDGADLEITWEYRSNVPAQEAAQAILNETLRVKPGEVRSICTCRLGKVKNQDNVRIIASGGSIMSPNEKNFVKAVAREQSLKRALRGFGKGFRLAVWKAYFAITKPDLKLPDAE